MRFLTPWVAIALAGLLVLAGGSAWWAVWPRPTLEGAAARIASGRFRAAEAQLDAYLAAYPGDEAARPLLARLLVERPDRDPEEALRLIDGLDPADPHRAAEVRAIDGEAHFWAGRYDRAEPAWLEALRLDPKIPEVGWKLLNIYAIQGRDDDSRSLALRLFAVEPDPRDRVQLLLQLIRRDAIPNEPGSIVHELEPIVRANPADLRSSTALGLAMIRSGRAEEGLALLRRNAMCHANNVAVWLAFFDALMSTGALEELTLALEGLPGPMAGLPGFDEARGWIATQNRDLNGAIQAYRRALDARPSDATLAYRLKTVLRQADRTVELAELGSKFDAIARFPEVARTAFERLNERPDLGLTSQPEEFGRLARALEQVGRQPEAAAWTLLAARRGGGPP